MFIFICGFSGNVVETLFEKNDNIFHIFDQFKVSRVPLQIGQCHNFMNIIQKYMYSPFKEKIPIKTAKYFNWNFTQHIIFIIYRTRKLGLHFNIKENIPKPFFFKSKSSKYTFKKKKNIKPGRPSRFQKV